MNEYNEERMYLGIDRIDGRMSLVWVKGELMSVSTYFGDGDVWLNTKTDFNYWPSLKVDLDRFGDLVEVPMPKPKRSGEKACN